MRGLRPPRPPEDLRAEILSFLSELRYPVLVQQDGSEAPLTRVPGADSSPGPSQPAGPVAASGALEPCWRLEVEFGKLLLEVWGGGRSVVRRIESVERDGRRLFLRARAPAGVGQIQLQLREADDTAAEGEAQKSAAAAGSVECGPKRLADDRATFERELAAMLGREFPGMHVEGVSHRTDREHCFSGCYIRGWARRGRERWAFLGLSEVEGPSAVESVLAYGLIWLDWLRERAAAAREAGVVTGLKLLLPPQAVAVSAHRAAYLDRRLSGIEILEWSPGQESPRPVDLRDYGNVQTRLAPRRRGAMLVDQLRPLVRGLLQQLPPDLAGRVSIVPDAAGEALSLRVFGLEVARIEGREPPRVWLGVEGARRELTEGGEAEFVELIGAVLRLRCARSPNRAHAYYRLQPERWLESLLVDDITRLDPTLRPEHVYPQVPAFTGPASPGLSRGVIDVLSATRDPASGAHRLAVVELKLDEDPNLPLQGLDYWLRVKWLEERDQFREHGYFAGLTPSPAPPVLYLVSPAFRFHSTTERILRYFHPSVRVAKVGLNQRWREGVRVLFRRTLEQGRVIDERPAEGGQE